jgi:group I intron endonuclease
MKKFSDKAIQKGWVSRIFARVVRKLGIGVALRVSAFLAGLAAAPFSAGLSAIISAALAAWTIVDLYALYDLLFGSGNLEKELEDEDAKAANAKSPTLENNTNNIRYIGKANNVQQRFKFHLLDKGKTHKTCWLKSIDYNISYIILDEVDKSEWQFWEIYWINQCKVWGFNLTNQTLGGEGGLGKKLSEEHKQKISIKLKGKIVSSETKQKLSKSIKGKKLSETHIRNLSKSHKGLIYPKGNYGKHCKRKIGQYKEGILIKVWDSLKDASEFYKVHYASISHCCAGRKKQIKGYIWKYVD